MLNKQITSYKERAFWVAYGSYKLVSGSENVYFSRNFTGFTRKNAERAVERWFRREKKKDKRRDKRHEKTQKSMKTRDFENTTPTLKKWWLIIYNSTIFNFIFSTTQTWAT